MIGDKVSIIIPCYNQAQYLPQCLESALGQDYSNVEVIVVDDGSTDNTYEIALSYWQKINDKYEAEVQAAIRHWTQLDREEHCRDEKALSLEAAELLVRKNPASPTMKIIRQKNMGLALARNAGINASTARSYEFILPLDADDWIDKDYLKKTVPLMEKHGVAIVGTWAACFGIKDYVWHTFSPTIEQLMIDNSIPVCSLLRRGVVDEVKGYNPQLSGYDKNHIGYEDWNLWIDITKRGYKVSILQEAIFHYREKPDSMLKKSTEIRPKLIEKIHSLHTDLWPTEGRSMLGKWEGVRKSTMDGREHYGVEETYQKAAAFLGDGPVEDWGCGTAYAKRFFKCEYKGVDGTLDGCDIVADLAKYKSNTHGILIRHVLEHNFEWRPILENALASSKKLAIVVCTPFEETTRLIRFDEHGIPIFSFRKEDLTKYFTAGYTEESVFGLDDITLIETIFYVNGLGA